MSELSLVSETAFKPLDWVQVHETLGIRDENVRNSVATSDWASLDKRIKRELAAGKVADLNTMNQIWEKYKHGQLITVLDSLRNSVDAEEEYGNPDLVVGKYNISSLKVRVTKTEKMLEALPEQVHFSRGYSPDSTDAQNGQIKFIPPEESFDVDNDDDYYPSRVNLVTTYLKHLPEEQKRAFLDEKIVPYLLSGLPIWAETRAFRNNFKNETEIDKSIKKYMDEHNPLMPTSETINFPRLAVGEVEEQMAEFLGDSTIDKWLNTVSARGSLGEIKKGISGRFVPNTYPELINGVRNVLKSDDISPAKKEVLIKLGRILLGENPDDEKANFFTTLATLYESIKFENYRPNRTSTVTESNIVEAVTIAVGENLKVIDMGCGTGRHLAELRSHQNSNNEYVGVEINDRHIEIAKAALRDESGVVKGSMTDMPFESGSVDMAYSVGCTLPHAESTEEFGQIMDEAYRVLKPGGILVFDMPDVRTSNFPEHRERFFKAMAMLGIPEEMQKEAKNMNVEYIIDGPEEGKLYNRYVPEKADIIKEAGQDRLGEGVDPFVPGFLVSELTHNKVDDGNGRENIFFIAYKPDLSELPEDLLGMKMQVEKLTEKHGWGPWYSSLDVREIQKFKGLRATLEDELKVLAEKQFAEKLKIAKEQMALRGL